MNIYLGSQTSETRNAPILKFVHGFAVRELIERNVIFKAPDGEPRLSFRRLENYLTFSSLTAILSAWWYFNYNKIGTFGIALKAQTCSINHELS